MKLIDKHLLREYLLPLIYCLCTFCMLYIVLSLFEYIGRLMEAEKSFMEVVQFFAWYMVAYTDSMNMSFVVIILPVSLLCGTLYSLYRLTRQNELTAMRASGVSLYRLLYPFIGVALVCSLCAAYVQEFVAPEASRRLDAMKQELRAGGAESSVFLNLNYFNREERRIWKIRRIDLASPDSIEGITITVERENKDMSRESIISAERGEWVDGVWQFYGVSERRYTVEDRPDGPVTGPVAGPVEMPGLTETPEDFVVEANPKSLEKYSSSWAFLEHVKNDSSLVPADRQRMAVDGHVRLAMPWACIVVALMGIPAGMRGGRQGAVAAIMLAVGAFLGFYVFMQVGLFLGKRLILDPWLSAWLANLVFFIVGLVTVLRIR